MSKILLLVAGGLMLACSQAYAIPRVWISGKGVDQASCGPAVSPCRTLQYAHDLVDAGGEIDVLDSAGYGSLVIRKALNIINDGSIAGVLAPANGEAIRIIAGVNDSVLLRGLTIEGSQIGAIGISFLGGASLVVDKCLISGFVGTADPAGTGIYIANTAGQPNIAITDTTIANNADVGLYYFPQQYTGGKIVIDHVRAVNNKIGALLDIHAAATNGLSFTAGVSNSVFSNNTATGLQINRFVGSNIGRGAYIDSIQASGNKVGIEQIDGG